MGGGDGRTMAALSLPLFLTMNRTIRPPAQDPGSSARTVDGRPQMALAS